MSGTVEDCRELPDILLNDVKAEIFANITKYCKSVSHLSEYIKKTLQDRGCSKSQDLARSQSSETIVDLLELPISP